MRVSIRMNTALVVVVSTFDKKIPYEESHPLDLLLTLNISDLIPGAYWVCRDVVTYIIALHGVRIESGMIIVTARR